MAETLYGGDGLRLLPVCGDGLRLLPSVCGDGLRLLPSKQQLEENVGVMHADGSCSGARLLAKDSLGIACAGVTCAGPMGCRHE